jgi:hypothetical protein
LEITDKDDVVKETYFHIIVQKEKLDLNIEENEEIELS